MFFQLWGSFTNSKNQKITQNLSFKKKSKHNSTKIFKNFKIFQQKNITIQKFLKINVPRFLEIHGP